jgi:hypothetical protein
MHKFFPIIFDVVLSLSMFPLSQAAQAQEVCRVTDPTGTPLNVRDFPNGKVINTLKNGTVVTIEEMATDERGRPWARIASSDRGNYTIWGWVIREFISCYQP